MSSAAIEVDEASFDVQVLTASHERPVLLDISADWCAPCRVLAPVLEQAVMEVGGAVTLAVVDADENMRLAGRLKVRGFPTVVVFWQGQEFERFQSAQTLGFVRGVIARVVATASA